jgi:hypothetical protein
MCEEAPYVSPPPDAEGPYKYYLLGNVRPVRVTCNARGRACCTEAPDRAHGGALKIDHELWGRILASPEVETITKAEFVERCRRAVRRANE